MNFVELFKWFYCFESDGEWVGATGSCFHFWYLWYFWGPSDQTVAAVIKMIIWGPPPFVNLTDVVRTILCQLPQVVVAFHIYVGGAVATRIEGQQTIAGSADMATLRAVILKVEVEVISITCL